MLWVMTFDLYKITYRPQSISELVLSETPLNASAEVAHKHGIRLITFLDSSKWERVEIMRTPASLEVCQPTPPRAEGEIDWSKVVYDESDEEAYQTAANS